MTAGIDWVSRDSAVESTWSGMAFGNDIFVAVAYSGAGDRIMTSPDGITWTSRAAPEQNSWLGIAFGNGLFVAVSSDGTNRVMTSPDGITWTARAASSVNSWMSITYGNGLFVAAAYYTNNNLIMTSPDGITWTTRTTPVVYPTLLSVTYGDGLFVAVGYRNFSGDNIIIISSDGITWTPVVDPFADHSYWTGIAYGDGLFVAVASLRTNRAMSSPDGINWTVRNISASTWNAITYGNGLFVAVAEGGVDVVSTSPDGITWTGRTAPDDGRCIVYADDIFVTASRFAGDQVMTSGKLDASAEYCSNVEEDYISLYGLSEKQTARFGSNRYINLVDYLPLYLEGSETEIFLKFFEDYLNIIFDGENGLVISANELTITRDVPDDNDKFYTYIESQSSTSVTATTSADEAIELIFDTSSTAVENNLTIPLSTGEEYNQKISILEKIHRLTELHDPDLIDINQIQYHAANLGYDVSMNRAQIGTNLGVLTNQSVTSASEDDYNRDKYLRFIVRNLPTWYKIKTTRNSIKTLLYSFGLIADIIEYYSNDYINNWKLNYDNNLTNIPVDYFPTSHFVVQINIDDSIGSISFDWDRRQKVINAIESVRPVNTVFKKLSGYADREIIVHISANMRIRNNIVIR